MTAPADEPVKTPDTIDQKNHVPELLEALTACVKAYDQHRDGQPTGNHWCTPNHIFNARRVIASIEGGV